MSRFFQPTFYLDFIGNTVELSICPGNLPQDCGHFDIEEVVSLLANFESPRVILGGRCDPLESDLKSINTRLHYFRRLASIDGLRLDLRTSSALVLLLMPILKALGQRVEVRLEYSAKKLDICQAYASLRRAGIETLFVNEMEEGRSAA